MLTIMIPIFLQSIKEWEDEVSKDDETEDEILCRLLDSKKVNINILAVGHPTYKVPRIVLFTI